MDAILVLVVLFEIAVAIFVCWGILHEDKLIRFERKIAKKFLRWLDVKARSYPEVIRK